MKPFEHWEREELQLTFGLQRQDNDPVLAAWLAAGGSLSPEEAKRTEALRVQLRAKVDFWNEDEIKIFFITDIVKLVDFNKPGVYSTFSQRTISTKKKDVQKKEVTLRGRVEMLVATGEQKPREPFFFIHEYKPQLKSSSNDPLGQLLVAMLAAQEINNHKQPLYGLYVLGRQWYFVVLHGSQYAVSDLYDSVDKADLERIVLILKQCKAYIDAAVATA